MRPCEASTETLVLLSFLGQHSPLKNGLGKLTYP